ncbi:MAG: hypothetical protein PHE54_04375 [Bacilli bacterium]|nr:hypothetical protein [Bacilli bacterium]
MRIFDLLEKLEIRKKDLILLNYYKTNCTEIFSAVQKEGKHNIRRENEYYNLEEQIVI